MIKSEHSESFSESDQSAYQEILYVNFISLCTKTKYKLMGRRKAVVCTNLKQTSTKCGAALWCVGQCWEKYHIYKKSIWMSL